MELKERIAKLRRIKNLTQAELAEKVGVTTRSIQNYELGTRVPKMDTVVKIAEALGVDEKVLMSDEDYFVIEAHEKYGSRGKKDAEELVKFRKHILKPRLSIRNIRQKNTEKMMTAIPTKVINTYIQMS